MPILYSDYIACSDYFKLSVYTWGILLAYMRGRFPSRLCFHVFWEAGCDNEDQGPVIGDVQDSIVIGSTQRNSRKLSWLATNMIVAYAHLVIEKVIPSTDREVKSS